MNYNEQPRLTIFKNKHAGEPITKDDGSFVNDSNGKPIKQSELNGKIKLPVLLNKDKKPILTSDGSAVGLLAGDYEIAIYKRVYTDKKTGESKTMYSGRIKKAYVKKDKAISQHSVDKGNGYQPEQEDSSEFPF